MTQPLSYGRGGNLLYYRHSNRVRPVGLLLGAAVGLGAGLAMASIYAFATVYVPLVYAHIALAFAFGVALGYVPARIMRWGKTRSVPIVLAVVGVVAGLSYLFHWIVWIYALAHKGGLRIPFLLLAEHPRLVLRAMERILGIGGGRGARPAPNAGTHALAWLVEAATILGSAMLVAKKMQGKTPFCEACGDWCPPRKKLCYCGPASPAVAKARLEAHDWTYLDELGPSPDEANHWLGIFHDTCPRCNKLHMLSAVSFNLVVNANSHSSMKKTVLVDKLLVDVEEIQTIRDRAAWRDAQMIKPDERDEQANEIT